jgi:cation diffusion facilitator family transporter
MNPEFELHEHKSANREKNSAALTSVVAAVGLTGFKLLIGILTNSLGILAEAAHSALDLVAAVVTLVAVHISGKPADSDHNYGHGKVENLSALFEVFLLLITCIWIIYEAIQRLFFHAVNVEVSIWSFIVMGTSILIDYSRSRVLFRAARKHKSQALEADALHFSTDIWSSSVVIGGLAFVLLSNLLPGLSFLRQADAVAAMVVAGIVVFVSVRMGIRTVHGLLDSAPAGVADKVKAAVEGVSGVLDCHAIRVRYSGPQVFVDVHILVSRDQNIVAVHELTERIEAAIQTVVPGADTVVHPEPVDPA